MTDPLVETWAIHDRIHRYLLDAIPDDALVAALPKCRSVSDLFGHVHDVWFISLHPSDYLYGCFRCSRKSNFKTYLAILLGFPIAAKKMSG